CIEFVVAYFACQKVGAIPLMCLPAFRHAEMEYFARFVDAVAYFIPAEFRMFNYVPMAEEIRRKVPALKHIFVAGRPADACAISGVDNRGTFSIDELLETTADSASTAKLAACHPDPAEPAGFLLSGGTAGIPKVIQCN